MCCNFNLQVKKNFDERGNKIRIVISTAKIVIIVFVAIYLISHFEPFFEGSDSHLYGIASVNLSNGVYSITNELLEETGRIEFVGDNWLKTVHNTAIPRSGIGFFSFASIAHLVGGYFGLFYLTPIITITFLIIAERVSTNLFGRYVGLLTLIFLATNHLVYRTGIKLGSESFFAIFLILGSFYLIKFFQTKEKSKIILASAFFAFSPLIRLNGIVFFPIEILLVFGFLIILSYKNQDKSHSSNFYFIKFPLNKKIIAIIVLLFLPWIAFFSFYFIYYEYYFDDPFTNYRLVNPERLDPDVSGDSTIEALLSFQEKDFENVKQFSKYVLPYQLTAEYNRSNGIFDEQLGSHWPGLIGLAALALILFISLVKRIHRKEIITFAVLILGTIWFLSIITTEELAAFGVPGRYIMPVFTFMAIMYGIGITKFFHLKIKSYEFHLKILKYVALAILFVFFILAFYYTPLIQEIINDKLEFTNPFISSSRYPLENDSLPNNSVILAIKTDEVIERNLIPFQFRTISEEMESRAVELLEEITSNGYSVYVFKEPTHVTEKDWLKQIVIKHNLVLKDYSSSFCKLTINSANSLEKSDKICLVENMDDIDKG